MNKPQKERVTDRLQEVGYVDNFWAIQNYMLRLGAIIFDLKKDGWEFRGEFGEGPNKKNFYYHLLKKPETERAPFVCTEVPRNRVELPPARVAVPVEAKMSPLFE